jgi:hypothetical protein
MKMIDTRDVLSVVNRVCDNTDVIYDAGGGRMGAERPAVADVLHVPVEVLCLGEGLPHGC